MALSRTYRLLTLVMALDADGREVSAETKQRVWIAREGRADPVLSDMTPIGQWVLDQVAALELAGPSEPTEI